MIPTEHVLLLALLQFTLGLLGVLLRRAALVVLVSAVVMLNGVLLAFFAATAHTGSSTQSEGVAVLALVLTAALSGAAVIYAFFRFRRTVCVDEYDEMKH